MMTDREKLVELLDYIRYSQELSYYDLYDLSDAAEPIADFLMSKGVTVQRWVPVTEKLPDNGEWVLTYYGNSYGCIMAVMEWTGEIWRDANRQAEMDGFITHWMPLPEPPKERTL